MKISLNVTKYEPVNKNPFLNDGFIKAINTISNQELMEYTFSQNLISDVLKMICFHVNNIPMDEIFDKNLESCIDIIKECELLKFAVLGEADFSFDLVQQNIMSLLTSQFYPKISKVILLRKLLCL